MMVILNRKKLRRIRKAKSFTQEQLAEYSGISDRHMRTLESKNVDPSASVLYRISRALDTPMDEFLEILEEDEDT